MFILLPYQHSESKEDAALSLQYTEEMEKSTSGRGLKIQGLLEYAQDHKKVIDQFGRYPYRNKVLGRETTPEELEYLKTANTYGQ